MKVDKLALGRVFDRTERLEAPLFQRPYVWNEDDNWVPLWDARLKRRTVDGAQRHIRTTVHGLTIVRFCRHEGCMRLVASDISTLHCPPRVNCEYICATTAFQKQSMVHSMK